MIIRYNEEAMNSVAARQSVFLKKMCGAEGKAKNSY
jgi:hypothetical protein